MNRLNIHTGVLIAAMTLSACTNTPVPTESTSPMSAAPSQAPVTQPATTTTTSGYSLKETEIKRSGFSYSLTIYRKFSEKRKSYTYSQADTPSNQDEQEFKKEIKLVYKSLKDFLNRTSVLVERYAHMPYINKTDRAKILKESNNPEKTGPVVVSILKDVYGPQSPAIDLSKIEESLCKMNGDAWLSFFDELRTSLREHKKSIKSEKRRSKGEEKQEMKEDKHFINELLDHEIWRLVKSAQEENSAERSALEYLKRQQCGGSAPVQSPVQTQQTPVKNENSQEQTDARNEMNETQNAAEPLQQVEGQPLGVRYYSPEQLENLQQPDPNAPNVFRVDPAQEQQLLLGT